MSDIAAYLEAIKDRYGLASDYALATKLGISQPEANLMRRGRKVPNPEVCLTMAKLLGKNPAQLLMVAQRDKAPAIAKEYWNQALAAVEAMLNVPQHPKYIPRKVEAIGRELRQLETQTLIYEGAAANAEAVRLMETVERSVDAIMERWNIWKKGEALYPNYLLANQRTAGRNVVIRRLLILTHQEMRKPSLVADAVQVMNDQAEAGIKIFYAFREDLQQSHAFQRFEEDYKKQGSAPDINAAMFDGEILIFSGSYGSVQLGSPGTRTPLTMINRLQITWKPDLLRDLNPAPLFDMTRYVFEYAGERGFRSQVSKPGRRTPHALSV